MNWSQWLIGDAERPETCRFCQCSIREGDPIVWDHLSGEPECIVCHWERIRALTRKAKPKSKPKPQGAVMPWKPVGSSKPIGTIGAGTPISKWVQGAILEGTLVDIRQAKFGPIFEFNDDKLGTVVYGVPTRLGFKLEKVSVGDRLRIECLGKVPGPGVNQVWDFNVMKDEA